MRSGVAPALLRHSVARNTIRQSNLASKRFASTSSEAAQKKAQDALASAGKTAEKVWDGAVKFLGPVGERVGNLLGAYRQPIQYNLAVAKEVIKKVYVAEGLQPPSIATFKEVYASVWRQVSSPSALRSTLQTQNLAQFSVYGLQAYGLYKIGEIIGRRSLVGYNIH